MAYPPLPNPLDEPIPESSSGVGDTLGATALSDRPGLCLSGGGYRATLFHIGSILRLNECGILSRIARISSVSGGSITAGALGAAWSNLTFDEGGVATNIDAEFVAPLLHLTDATIDIPNIALGLLPGISAARRVAAAYDRHVFHGKTLQDLPNDPVFVFNATNMRTGVLWRFLKDYMADYRIGMIYRPQISLAKVVGASSAFPPVLSPVKIDLRDFKIKKTPGADLHHAPYTDIAALTDGGVYDNLGLETVYKRHKTVFVSNGGGSVPDFAAKFNFWSTQLRRVITIMNGQHDSLRIRRLIDAYRSGERDGAYWGLNTRIKTPIEIGGIDISDNDIRDGENVRTRLNKFSATEKQSLIELGYALCDQAVRKHHDPSIRTADATTVSRAINAA